MKRLAILLILPLLLTGCNLLDDRVDKDDIFRYVQENQDHLEECIQNGELEAIKTGRVVKEIQRWDNGVEFSCGGAGMGGQTAYRGFFYTATDDLYRIWCAPPAGEPLVPDGSGFSWQEPEGDNRFYVEKICGHFYYYEASF